MPFKKEGEGNPGRQPKRKAGVRKELLKIKAIAALCDIVLERAERGELNILQCRPIELQYFERCDSKNGVVITCAAGETSNKWAVRGWHLDITAVDGFEVAYCLTQKKGVMVYRWREITRRDGKVIDAVDRTAIIAYLPSFKAIVAEMKKPATKKSVTPKTASATPPK